MVSGSDRRDGSPTELRLWGIRGGIWELYSAIELVSPSFVAAHPTLPVIYTVSEQEAGTVVSLQIDGAEAMTITSMQPSHGTYPTHLAVDEGGNRLSVANYESGTVAVYPLERNGSISAAMWCISLEGKGPDISRQLSSHAHHVAFRGDDLVVTDLGGDTVELFSSRGERVGSLPLPAGFGPRHSTWAGEHLLVVGELTAQVGSYRRTSQGWSWDGATSSTRGAAEVQPSGISVSDDGVFVANRGANTVIRLNIDEGTPSRWCWSEASCGGQSPRDLGFVNGALVVANQGSSTLDFLDPQSLEPRGSLHHDAVASVLELPSPR